MPKRPLEGHYGAMLASALLALIPFILVTTASVLYRKQLTQDLGAPPVALEIASGLATAAYAFGALLGGDLINRFRQRHLFLLFEMVFIAGCAIAASAPGILLYTAGRILFGFATGVLLVTALPPVIRRFPAKRMPFTAIFINIAFFGAVMAGPLAGGLIAAAAVWRLFYGGLAGIGIVALLLAILALPSEEPANRELPFDWVAIALALAATMLPFWGAAELTAHGFGSPLFWTPMGLGLIAFAALLLFEYHHKDALSPVKMMWSTFPVIGTLGAMAGGGVLVSFLMLAIQSQLKVAGHSPLMAGLSFWPQIIGVLIAASLVGAALRTRFIPLLVLTGMVLLLSAGALQPGDSKLHPGATLFAVSGLLGLGAGLTVAPSLFMAGFSLPSAILGRIFALIELVRSVADFILAPVVVKMARMSSQGASLTPAGIDTGVTLTMVIAALFTLLGLFLYIGGRSGLPEPDLEAWLERDGLAIHSPPLLAGFRATKPAQTVPGER